MKNNSHKLLPDETEHVMAGRWKYGEDFIRHTVKANVRKIQSLKSKVIVFSGFDEKEIYWISVDGVNYKVQEFRTTPDTKYFNHKDNGPGVKYEYALALRQVSIKVDRDKCFFHRLIDL